MLVAKKDNKVYDIEEVDKKRYLEDGYDIYENGEIKEHSPKKKIAYSEYVKVKEELEKVKADSNSSANAELTKQVEDLTKANTELTNSNNELTNANAELTKQVEKLTKQLEKANAKNE